MLIMIIMIAVDMMMWFSALGSFAQQRLFFPGGHFLSLTWTLRDPTLGFEYHAQLGV